MIKKSAIEQIGNTPLIELSRIYSGPGRLFGKAEFLQPGGSVKDRAALHIISASIRLLKSGTLKSNANVVTILCDTGMKY